MGKNLIQQARGKGGPRYRSPSFNFQGDIKLKSLKEGTITGTIIDLIHCAGHSAPLMQVKYADAETCLLLAPDGIRVGDTVAAGPEAQIMPGNILPLANIPEGTPIYNIESQPGDGGKFCRASGTNARMTTKKDGSATVLLPSKKERNFILKCRACIGTLAAGGRREKPILKAGHMFYKKRAKNKLYPRSRACAMNAVDHPFGNKRTARKAKQIACNHFAQPGQKVGKLWPRRTGRRK